jgi:predicted 3-demethylubiquinone-9 3-methyltransferase (glyoxalase superfamily)
MAVRTSPSRPLSRFFVTYATHAEVDAYWEQLSEGGASEQCDWLEDKYGVSRQIAPGVMGKMLNDPEIRVSFVEAFPAGGERFISLVVGSVQ